MGQLDFTPVEQSNQGEPQIVVFETQAAQPQARVPTHQLRLGGLSDTEKVDCVSALHCVRLAAGRQLLFRVGGNRVVHAQPRHAIGSGLPPDQVRVGQPHQCFDDGSDILAPADRLGCLERATRGESGQPAEHCPLGLAKQPVTPVDCGAQRLIEIRHLACGEVEQ